MPPFALLVEPGRLVGAAFRREGDRLALVERHVAPLPPTAFGGGPLGAPVDPAGGLREAAAELARRFSQRPKAASLVLPDAWARCLVVELGDLPSRPDLRREVLRFRVRKLVPFRVEELRLAAGPIAPVAEPKDPVRALVLFAADAVCTALEEAFGAAGVTIGQIGNASLARLAALAHRGRLPGTVAVAAVEPEGFTLVVARDGEPVLWRQKSFAPEAAGDRAPLLAAELRLTSTFLAERLATPAIDGLVLAASDDLAGGWSEVLAEGLGRPAASLEPGFLPLAELPSRAEARDLALLVGAACQEVA